MSNAKIEERSVKTHSSAIQISHHASLVQYKAWLILLRNAYHELPDSGAKKHKMRIADLCAYLGYDANKKRLKTLLEDLVKTVVTWNILGKDDENEWGVAALLAGCKVKKGVIEYDYSVFLKEKLYNPKMFALLNLNILNKFTSKHSLALYSVCKDYVGIGRTPKMEIQTFREFMGLEAGEYPDFKSLNRRVIKEPIEEINALSDLNVEAEYYKEKKKVMAVRFLIKEKSQIRIYFPTSESAAGETAIDAAIEDIEEDVIKNEALLNRLLSFGLTEKQSKRFIETLDKDYINANLDIVEKNCKVGKVANVSAYTMTALKEDYRPRETFLEKEKQSLRAREQTLIDRLQKRDMIQKLLDDYDIERIAEALKALNASEKRGLEEAFVEAKKKDKDGDFVLGYYRREGMDHIVVRGAFYSFVKAVLFKGPPKLKAFQAYMESQGHKFIEFRESLKDFAFEK